MGYRTISSVSEWTALTDRWAAPLSQRWAYGAVAERLGRRVLRLSDGDTTLQALSFRGVTLISQASLTNRRTLRGHLPPGLTLITPTHPLRGLPLSRGCELAELDLTRPNLRAGLHQNWRHALTRAEGFGLTVRGPRVSEPDLHALLRSEKTRQAQHRYKALPPEFMLGLYEAAPKDMLLFQTLDAQMLFMIHGNSASYLVSHTGPTARQKGAGQLLMWRAIDCLRAKGIARLHLGRIDRRRAAGLARFKLRMGAEITRLWPTVIC